jgi:type II secretory pathway pseudopilin PulG
MKRCAFTNDGAYRFHRKRKRFSGGFTLLEICTVLFIFMILLGATMPAMHSAFVEQAVRGDARQLSLMVKTAMIQSEEQHRAYVIDLTATTMELHPMDEAAKDAESEDVSITRQLDKPNTLLVPDPKKTDGWIAMPPTSWFFQPGELCPASRVRLTRGDDWMEVNFNALTGNVENEASYFP